MAAAPKPAPVKAEVPGVEVAKQGPAGAEPRTEPKLTVSEPAKAPATEAAPAPVVDPFSVDAIEAEFARLLGRATPPPKG